MRATRVALGALLLLALALRVIPWLANLPLHHDEALYGTWGRAIADGSDPLLLIPWVDKPPLVLYLLGLSIKLFGSSELSLRVPGMIASALTVWATFGLARRVVGKPGAWIAAGLVALSPFAILFAPTAFTDGWLALFVIAAAWAALARRPGWAGVLLGLACASKQQGVMAIPLILALLVVGNVGLEREGAQVTEGHEARSMWAALGVAVLGFVIVFGAVTYWDSLRWHNRPSYWDQSLQAYGGVVLAPLAEWPNRALEWARQAGYWFGAWPITVLLLALAGMGTRPSTNATTNERMTPAARARSSFVHSLHIRGWPRPCLVLLAYVFGYLLVHLAVTFQAWDRYLLPILPLVCVLCGAGLVAGWDSLRSHRGMVARRWIAAGLTAGLLYAATLGPTVSIPVGSDIGAYHGVAEAARFLAGEPSGTIVYYDRIGWHLGYYLYGRPITRSWYDSPPKLASETLRMANEHAGVAQWLALPAWEVARLPSLTEALAAKGFVAELAYEVAARNGSAGVTLYRLERDDSLMRERPKMNAPAPEQRPANVAHARAVNGVAKRQVGRTEGRP